MITIKFDTLKSRAKKQLGYAAKNQANLTSSQTGWLNNSSFNALSYIALNRARYTQAIRPALADFATAFNSAPQDTLAQLANSMANRTVMVGNATQELSLLALKAREEAFDIIDRWDVRCVTQLIDLFPDIVSNKQQQAQVSVFMADNANSDWMVTFHATLKRAPSVPSSHAA